MKGNFYGPPKRKRTSTSLMPPRLEVAKEPFSAGVTVVDGTSNSRTLNATILVVQNLINNIKQVTAGPRQPYCWARQGLAYALGSRVSDQLCVGEQVYAKKSPFPMVGLHAPILKIFAGAQHVIVLAGHPVPSSSWTDIQH
ncbi:Hypp8378 [Branchiostoma lanceolatum]|uniref:Hypp8378 protein n=1 Tax=Branchiostoma lanceolatum TaxID=7740 RepID=A0A8K0EEK5_BRALA|nr:Hypp8378 [Branchiostoma lanceolatum]